MDIEIKRMSSDTIELFDRLNIVCKRFHVDDLHASEKDRFFVSLDIRLISISIVKHLSPKCQNVKSKNRPVTTIFKLVFANNL